MSGSQLMHSNYRPFTTGDTTRASGWLHTCMIRTILVNSQRSFHARCSHFCSRVMLTPRDISNSQEKSPFAVVDERVLQGIPCIRRLPKARFRYLDTMKRSILCTRLQNTEHWSAGIRIQFRSQPGVLNIHLTLQNTNCAARP